MSRINAFECDSCKEVEEAKWNGEHYLPPDGWVNLHDFNLAQDVGHLCGICRETAVSANLRATKLGKRIEKIYK